MIREIELFIALVVLLIGVVLIFNARHIVKKKLNNGHDENISVTILKVFGTILVIGSLYFTYII